MQRDETLSGLPTCSNFFQFIKPGMRERVAGGRKVKKWKSGRARPRLRGVE
jgi:hypothetical protein